MTTQGFVDIVKSSGRVFCKAPNTHFKTLGENVNFKSINTLIPSDAIELSCKNKSFAGMFSEAIQSIKASTAKTAALGCSILLAGLFLGYKLFNKPTKSVKNDTNNQ